MDNINVKDVHIDRVRAIIAKVENTANFDTQFLSNNEKMVLFKALSNLFMKRYQNLSAFLSIFHNALK